MFIAAAEDFVCQQFETRCGVGNKLDRQTALSDYQEWWAGIHGDGVKINPFRVNLESAEAVQQQILRSASARLRLAVQRWLGEVGMSPEIDPLVLADVTLSNDVLIEQMQHSMMVGF